MRLNVLKLCVFLGVLLLCAQSWAVCPEQPFDGGECDTLHVNIYPPDQDPAGDPPYFVRFPIRVTNDVADAAIDSIAGFIIPLCFTHSNSAAYCSLSSYWNNTELFPYPHTDHSIFRHLDGETNWMMWGSEHSPIIPWDYIVLDLDGDSHFRLALAATGSQDQRFWPGSRVLLATMTFKLEDTTTICMDSCFWPPSDRLAFGNSAAQLYVPRHYLPVCELVGPQPHPPTFTHCPDNASHHENGLFSSTAWEAEDAVDAITSVSAVFEGTGVTDVSVWYYGFPPPPFGGYIRYQVADHCAEGGTITVTARDQAGYESHCQFDVELGNDPPGLSTPDTLLAIAGATRAFLVPGSDPNGDPVATSFNTLWYQPDSLRIPTYSPSYEPGNPGYFVWPVAEPETGTWITSFWATDACDSQVDGQVTIVVNPLYCGNMVDDDILELSDVIFLENYLYRGGPAPNPPCKADMNCDGVPDLGDFVYLINYLYKFGNAPCAECCGSR
jgi:hypothetical protein